MKIIITTFLLAVLCSSCCREYHCVKGGGIDIVFNGYTKNELDSVTLFFYTKNNLFFHPIDSVKQPGLFFDTTSTIIIMDFNYDYALTLFADTFYISRLEEEITTFKSCTGAMPKMGTCHILDTYIVSGKNISKEGNTITIHK